MIGPPEGEITRGSRRAAREHGVPLEEVDVRDAVERFPAFRVPEGNEVLWEPSGGYLRVEECVRAYARRAVAGGAEIRSGETLVDFTSTADGVTVRTNRETYSVGRLVLSPGAWAPALMPSVAARSGMHVLRKVLGWYPRRSEGGATPDSTFFVELPHGCLLYTSPSPRDATLSRMPSSA